MWLKIAIVSPMQKRILLLPLVWGVFGVGEVLVLNYLYGPIVTIIPFPANDKPIGGSYLPALFFNFAALVTMLGLSLYALGFWNIDFSSRGILLFYYAIFLFPFVVAVVYFLATNID